MIDERPTVVERHNRIGDWKGDTIVGKGHQRVLVNINERKSRYILLGHSRHKSKDLVAEELTKRLEPYKDQVKSMAFDNGREFTDHERMAEELDMSVYFALPYSSWERGTNENSNGLVRRFFPKGQSLLQVSDEELEWVMERCNHHHENR